MYLSTFSLHKIILFLNKLKAPATGLKSLFSSCMSTSTHTKWIWNNTNNFITFCIANSNKINYLMTKIEFDLVRIAALGTLFGIILRLLTDFLWFWFA